MRRGKRVTCIHGLFDDALHVQVANIQVHRFHNVEWVQLLLPDVKRQTQMVEVACAPREKLEGGAKGNISSYTADIPARHIVATAGLYVPSRVFGNFLHVIK